MSAIYQAVRSAAESAGVPTFDWGGSIGAARCMFLLCLAFRQFDPKRVSTTMDGGDCFKCTSSASIETSGSCLRAASSRCSYPHDQSQPGPRGRTDAMRLAGLVTSICVGANARTVDRDHALVDCNVQTGSIIAPLEGAMDLTESEVMELRQGANARTGRADSADTPV